MSPLQLLALIFISTGRREDEEDVKDWRRQGEEEAEEKLRRGDLLVVPRTLFTHFGIYLGRGRSVLIYLLLLSLLPLRSLLLPFLNYF